jgi:C-terminal processing protease CtpA/Prc
VRIGYLRLPTFSGTNSAVNEVRNEVRFFNENTDVLVLDITRNPGGTCFYDQMARLFMDRAFLSLGDQIKPTWAFLEAWRNELAAARRLGASQEEINAILEQLIWLEEAYAKGESSRAFPACGYSFLEEPDAASYRKPLVVLIDEMSISAADFFAATLMRSPTSAKLSDR